MAILTFSGTRENDPRILEWIADHQSETGRVAAQWFRTIRQSGPDVLEVLHDGYPTACIGEFPFAYVGAFKQHANVGFLHGADLPDPEGLLQGTGKRMRHVKLLPRVAVNERGLEELINAAYQDIKRRIDTAG